MLTFSTITNDDELNAFSEAFAQYVNVKLPLAYLKQGKVVGCYDLSGALVGGYALITEPKFRGLGFVPDAVKAESKFLCAVPESSMMEVNAVWLSRSITSKRIWLTFWRRIIKDTLRCDRSYVIVYYNAGIKGLARWYSYLGTKEIFTGQPQLLPGQRTHNALTVGYATRTGCRMWLWKASFHILKRFLFNKIRGVEVQVKTANVSTAKDLLKA